MIAAKLLALCLANKLLFFPITPVPVTGLLHVGRTDLVFGSTKVTLTMFGSIL